MTITTMKYRVYPTKKQATCLEWTLARCCEAYNAALQERRDTWTLITRHGDFYDEDARTQVLHEHRITCYSQINQLPAIKEVREEYKEIHSQVLQDVLKRVDRAFHAFFRRVAAGQRPGYPRYQGRDHYDSFTYPQGGFTIEGNRLVLSKIGHIKITLHRPIQGRIKTCTLKREGSCWYVCLACEIDTTQERHTPYTDQAVGIDVGLSHFAALSTGDLIDNPRPYRKAKKKLPQLQQAVARKKHGSKRHKQAVRRVAQAHRKVARQRADFLHRWSRRLVETYEVLVFEDLAPLKMSRAPKPKQDETIGVYLPNGAAAKAGLNLSILDAGWSTFVRLCTYKAANAGMTQVYTVDPFKTSQTCSACLHEGAHKDLSERVHTCEACGVVLDRDVNAARVILAVWQDGLKLRPAPKHPKKPRSGRDRQETRS